MTKKTEGGCLPGCLLIITIGATALVWPGGWYYSVGVFFLGCWLIGLVTPPVKCQVCGNPLRQSGVKWKIEGKMRKVCRHCNETLERRQSRGGIDQLG